MQRQDLSDFIIKSATDKRMRRAFSVVSGRKQTKKTIAAVIGNRPVFLFSFLVSLFFFCFTTVQLRNEAVIDLLE